MDDFLLDKRKIYGCYVFYDIIQFFDKISITQRTTKRFLNRVFLDIKPELVQTTAVKNFVETSNWETLTYFIKLRYQANYLDYLIY